jgi:hypothetical protein
VLVPKKLGTQGESAVLIWNVLVNKSRRLFSLELPENLVALSRVPYLGAST